MNDSSFKSPLQTRILEKRAPFLIGGTGDAGVPLKNVKIVFTLL